MVETLLIIALVLIVLTLVVVVVVALRMREGREQVTVDLIDRSEVRLREEMARLREAQEQAAQRLQQGIQVQMGVVATQVTESIKAFGGQFAESHRLLTDEQQRHIEQFRSTLETSLSLVREETRQKLEEIRQMVDERLQQTLETRLGESFRTVSEQLRAVHEGLGEMRELAGGVADLKRVLSNVSVRGQLGEAQLKALLDQFLAPGQYEEDVATNPQQKDARVEFAIRIPSLEPQKSVWLPIDAKFPLAHYERYLRCLEMEDKQGAEQARSGLIAAVKNNAKNIAKYIAPPNTTPLAIMFLPNEGLYAEVARDAGLLSEIQQTHQVLVTGPTTLAAVLTTIQMAFRVVAIERKSHEVLKLLSAVKTELTKFGEALDKIEKKLEEAQRAVESTQTRKRVMERKLKDVEAMPEAEATQLLGDNDEG